MQGCKGARRGTGRGFATADKLGSSGWLSPYLMIDGDAPFFFFFFLLVLSCVWSLFQVRSLERSRIQCTSIIHKRNPLIPVNHIQNAFLPPPPRLPRPFKTLLKGGTPSGRERAGRAATQLPDVVRLVPHAKPCGEPRARHSPGVHRERPEHRDLAGEG